MYIPKIHEVEWVIVSSSNVKEWYFHLPRGKIISLFLLGSNTKLSICICKKQVLDNCTKRIAYHAMDNLYGFYDYK